MSHEAYDYAEWSFDRLERRLDDLVDTKKVNHPDWRLEQISREIAHVCFEIDSRVTEDAV